MNGIQDYQKLESAQNVNQHTGTRKKDLSIYPRCLGCGKVIFNHQEENEFCITCQGREGVVELKCETCGKYYISLNKKQRWCCVKCYNTRKKDECNTQRAFLKLRWEILIRDNFSCVYCGRNPSVGAIMQIDHVIPRKRDGKNNKENLVTACQECNNGKRDVLIPENVSMGVVAEK